MDVEVAEVRQGDEGHGDGSGELGGEQAMMDKSVKAVKDLVAVLDKPPAQQDAWPGD